MIFYFCLLRDLSSISDLRFLEAIKRLIFFNRKYHVIKGYKNNMVYTKELFSETFLLH